MKRNILFIVLITIIALGVIATVIFASFLNSPAGPAESGNSVYNNSRNVSDPDHPNNSGDPFVDSLPDSSSQSATWTSGSTVIGENIVNTARGILNREPKVPFAENGATLEGFDNSGFIYYVLRENGFMTCPRVLNEQTKMAARLGYNELKPGDLAFFYNDDKTEAGFGGIYIGGGKMIACLMPDTFVQEVDISVPYYVEHFYCGVSLS